MTRNIDDPARLNGTTVIGGDGEKLGSVDAVYYDNATDRPEWVAVRSGLFGTRVALVPLRRADYAGDELRVPFDRVQLKNAPHHDPGRELSSSDEADLYRYYGIDYGQFPDDSVTTTEFATGPLRDRDGNDRTRRTARAGHADEAMGRPAEPVPGTAPERAARLRKHAADEHRQTTMHASDRTAAERGMHAEVDTVELDADEVDRDLRERRYL